MISDALGVPARVLTAARAHRGLVTLCVTVTTSYGVLFYAFPVLSPAIAADTGWTLTTVTALFSASQVVAGLGSVAVGRWLHRRGPRPVMTAAALVAVPSLAVLASAGDLWLFGAAWLAAGAAMSGLFYPPAFAALTHWYEQGRVRALTALTLVAGLASTVFAPLTAALEQAWGWRGAYLVLAAVLALVVVPLHAFALPPAWSAPVAHGGSGAPGAAVRAVVRGRAFWALTASLALGSLTVYAVVVNLVPLLAARGLDAATAAWALGLGGVGQVLGRLVYAPLERRSAPVPRAVAVLGACAATTLLLALVPGPWAVLMAVAVLAGMARGVLTLLKATAVADRWGTGGYAAISGLMHLPLMLAVALAPWIGAALAGVLGGYPAAFAVLGALAAVGAATALASGPRPRPPPIPPGRGRR
ncbi:MFS transporter [Nocardiopsis sinuspersici]|uniref:MFS transporter n=1 Tax=Nocardiopsis sinuspersici TaxID=501010 RepID=A0A1V3BZ93_9ACTN|nr:MULTISPECIES: MFS transporter [Nocardiopsis]OOC53566.1 MFS transporter [Nocardiopsis sinuspersici]